MKNDLPYINLRKFLSTYLSIKDEKVIEQIKNVNDLKYKFPMLELLSELYCLDNIPLIFKGDIIIVRDDYSEMIFLKRDDIIKLTENIGNVEFDYKKEESVIKNSSLSLSELSVYELSKLYSYYRKQNSTYASVIRKELIKRHDSKYQNKLSLSRKLKKEKRCNHT